MPNHQQQSHSGSGDNIGGNKILNLSLPKIFLFGILIILALVVLIFWRTLKERFFFNQDKIDVMVSVIDSLQIRPLTEEEAEYSKPEGIVYYELAANQDTFNIYPNSAYLSKFSKNEAIGEEIRLYSLVPKINFKITNNSSETIFFSKVVLNVENSNIDPAPIPVFFSNPCYDGFASDRFYRFFDIPPSNGDYETEDKSYTKVLPVAIYNEGWGPMKNVKLNFDIDARAPYDQGQFNALPFSVGIPQIDTEAFVDIFPYLRAQGVDVDRIIDISSSTQTYYNDTNLMKHGLGKYATDDEEEAKAYVYGVISYQDENNMQHKSKFSIPVNMLRTWDCGAPALENGVSDISLCPTASNYEITYPISNYIKHGDVDNFSIRLNCSKSSVHRISVKLYYSEKHFIQKYINYHLIIPRRMVEDEIIIFKGSGKCRK